MFKSGVGFLALFGLGWWALATSAFDGPDETVRLAVGLIAAFSLWGMALWTVMGAASAAGRGRGVTS
ncbi:hypothetical protein AB0P17_27935 [Streptomyces sp. NPDC088124]|uniref:hypothetical protein n=1 Tax=Streptomyces sp. NPDC088124 TaxID=3154654 RepID=UPI0034438684